MTKKLHLLIILLCLYSYAIAQNAKSVNNFAEQMPYFKGCIHLDNETAEKRKCSNKSLIDFISQNIQYPELARTEGIEGTVLIKFVVNASGAIESSEVLRDIGGDCGAEALRIVALMPEWEPGIKNGNPVSVSLNLPVTFSLANADYLVKNKYQIQWGTLREKRITREQVKEHLSKKLYVRDEFGNEVSLLNLSFIFQKKRTYLEEKSTGKITRKMEKLVKKFKKGGFFTIVAAIQRDGKIYEIEREFEVVE